MAKKKMQVEMYTYGEYTRWDRGSKEIPKIIDITETINAEIGTEFGYVLHIKKAKGSVLRFRIDHPKFPDSSGKTAAPFTGEFHIPSNDYQWFLGDCIWEPIDNKLGNWTMTTYIDEKLVAQKTLNLKKKQ